MKTLIKQGTLAYIDPDKLETLYGEHQDYAQYQSTFYKVGEVLSVVTNSLGVQLAVITYNSGATLVIDVDTLTVDVSDCTLEERAMYALYDVAEYAKQLQSLLQDLAPNHELANEQVDCLEEAQLVLTKYQARNQEGYKHE